MVLLDTPTPYLYAYCIRTVGDCSLHAELQCIMFRACHPEISEATVRGMSLSLCSVSPPLQIETGLLSIAIAIHCIAFETELLSIALSAQFIEEMSMVYNILFMY